MREVSLDTSYKWNASSPALPDSVTFRVGDTMESIAAAHKIDVKDLMAANGIADPGKVLPGRELKIPPTCPGNQLGSSATGPSADPHPPTAPDSGSINPKALAQLKLRQSVIDDLTHGAIAAGLPASDVARIVAMGTLPNAEFNRQTAQVRDALNSAHPAEAMRAIAPTPVGAGTQATVAAGSAVTVGVTAASGSSVKIVSPVFRIGGRDFLVVETSMGRQAFYRSTGINSGAPDKWLPVDEFRPQDGWFNKEAYVRGPGLERGEPLHRLGNEEFSRISDELGRMSIPPGQTVPPGVGENEQMTANRILDFFRARQTPTTHTRPVPDPDAFDATTEVDLHPPGRAVEGVEGGTGAEEALGEGAVEAASPAMGGTALAGRIIRGVGEGLMIEAAIGAVTNYFSSIEEAQSAIKSESYQNGFAQGLSAAMASVPPGSVRAEYGLQGSTPSMSQRIVGAEGMAEQYHNKGLAAGYKYFQSLPPAQKQKLRDALAAKGFNVHDSSRDNVIGNLEPAVLPAAKDLLERAAEAARIAHQQFRHELDISLRR